MENDKKEEEKKKIKYIYILFLNLLVPGRRPAIRSQASGWRRWHSLSHTDQTVNHDFKIAALLRTLQTSLVIWPVSSGYYTGLSVIFNNVNEKALARASQQCNCKCNHSNILPSTLFSKITSYFPSEHQAEHFQIATRGKEGAIGWERDEAHRADGRALLMENVLHCCCHRQWGMTEPGCCMPAEAEQCFGSFSHSLSQTLEYGHFPRAPTTCLPPLVPSPKSKGHTAQESF